MWWNRSSRRSQSPFSPPSPKPFSSTLDLYHSADDPADDPDWMDSQLEQARLRRASFYRRLQSASSRRRHDDGDDDDDNDVVAGRLALYKPRKSPELDGVDESATSVDFEPHTSWRFYTSFDNGEWRRHAVPVFKVKDADQTHGLNGVSRYRRNDASKSSCQAAESSLRRTRHARTTAAELHRKRLDMRSNDLLHPGDALSSRWMFSNSVESVRDAASCDFVDAEMASAKFRSVDLHLENSGRGFDPDDGGRRSQRSDVTGVGGALLRHAGPMLTGSVVIDGVVDTTFKEKIIIPTKYKNTAAGIPELARSEVTEEDSSSTGIEPFTCESRTTTRETKTSTESSQDKSTKCMTGQGEGQTTRPSEEKKAVLKSQSESTKRYNLTSCGRRPGDNSSTGKSELNSVCERKSEQVVQRNGANVLNELLRKDGTETEEDIVSLRHEQGSSHSHDTARSLTILDRKQPVLNIDKPDSKNVQCRSPFPMETNSVTRENKNETPCGRSLENDVIHEQKQELTSKFVNNGTTDKKVSCEGDKIVRFVSVFYTNIGTGKSGVENNQKTDTFTVKEDKNTNPKPERERNSKPEAFVRIKNDSDGTTSDQEDNWVVEMAIRK